MKALRDWLTLTGMTQAELAKKAGLDATQINHFLTGRREPRIKNLKKLSAATGISVEKLIKEM